MKLLFLSSNPYKINEIGSLLKLFAVDLEAVSTKIHEIQSEDMKEIVFDKAIKGFREIGRPFFVEQTGLYIKDFANLPGGLTQIFWDSLQADKFCEYFSKTRTSIVTATTVLGYCDGKNIHIFEGQIDGVIVPEPRGDSAFQWDCVFQPNGYTQTFAEMGDMKNEISMRRIALEKLKDFVEGTNK